jgi:hypothetical protein
MADYTLPDLPYDYSALEPHVSGAIMELHHDKHHQAYVTGANTALEKLAEARASGDLGSVNLHEKNLSFHLRCRGRRGCRGSTASAVPGRSFASRSRPRRHPASVRAWAQDGPVSPPVSWTGRSPSAWR